MREIETDYLVVGAGASGMAFVDALTAASDDVDVVIVDRRHRPGGHWLDAYPFVRLHQPSANYGVNSRTLGRNQIDEVGPNAGFYERATAAEICDYYSRVVYDDMVPSGRVQFLGMTDYRGVDGEGHCLTSLLTGEETTVKVRKKFVDATYVESSIPSRHTPPYTADAGVTLLPPNDLVDLQSAPSGFTVIGCGKTAMDTCCWLLDNGVDADSIQWFRPRDPWLFNRTYMQPLELVGSYMHLQACYVAAAAAAEDGTDFTHRLEADQILLRIDSGIEPEIFRGATISEHEMDQLRTLKNLVPRRKVLHIGTGRIVTDDGDIATDPKRVYVDCTAPGVRPTIPRPIFENDRLTLQYVTIGIVPWSAAIVGTIEARDDDDTEKNRLCPPVVFTGLANDLGLAYVGMTGMMTRAADAEFDAWNSASRLNPAAGVSRHLDDPRVPAAFETIGANFGAAISNLERLTASPALA